MAKDVTNDEVRERLNQLEPAGPEPRGGLIHRQNPDQLARLVADPLTDSATLQVERERLEATAATVKRVEAERKRAEQAQAIKEAKRKRDQDAADAELVVVLDGARAKVLAVLPGLDTLAAEIEGAIQRHRDAVAPLGINSAVADRVVWPHPLARLLPWLNQFRHDGPPEGQREG